MIYPNLDDIISRTRDVERQQRTVHGVPSSGDVSAGNEVVDSVGRIGREDFCHFDASSKVYALAFEPESIGEAHGGSCFA
jgi:hypothetical protein